MSEPSGFEGSVCTVLPGEAAKPQLTALLRTISEGQERASGSVISAELTQLPSLRSGSLHQQLRGTQLITDQPRPTGWGTSPGPHRRQPPAPAVWTSHLGLESLHLHQPSLLHTLCENA